VRRWHSVMLAIAGPGLRQEQVSRKLSRVDCDGFPSWRALQEA